MQYKSLIQIVKLAFAVYTSSSVKAVIQNSAKLVALQVFAALLLFVNNYIIIRLCGDQIYGNYISIMAWVNLFSVIIIFGSDNYFITALPKIYYKEETKKGVIPVLLRALVILLIVFFLLSIVLAVLFYFNFFEHFLRDNQVYFFVLLLQVGVLSIFVAFFRGINRIILGQLIEKIFRPGLTILFSVLIFIVLKQLNLTMILLIHITVLLAAITFMSMQVAKKFPAFYRPRVIFDKSLKANAAFLFISILNLLSVRLDILFLTKTVLPAQVGYYNLGVRMADIIGFPLAAMNLVVPVLLSKESAANLSDTKKIITNASITAFTATLLVYLPALFLGSFILPLFGKNFILGYWPMVILGGSHLFSSLSHQINGFLMISGNQRYSLFCLIINVVVVFVFCRLLIPTFGLNGAAFSVLLGSMFYLAAIVIIYNKTGNHSLQIKTFLSDK